MISKFRLRTRLVLVAFLGLMLTSILRAQDTQPPEEEHQQAKETGPVDSSQQVDRQAVVTTAPQGPVDMDIHPAGKAIPWLGSSSPLRWGSFSIGNFTYEHVNDHFQPVGDVPSANLEL